ncbi:MAG: SDR family NAD(P)-dependent oxidoreductase [Rhodospirillaceae bacterium]|nr:SDR family NAD(P)-dependent oxidoreductase [Rhodospirillaceae bacterium]
MTNQKTVVVTGGTRGIGHGLALELLKRGNNVVICGRGQSAVNSALTELNPAATDGARVAGTTCDVTKHDQVQALWGLAKKEFGDVDIWINNAGMSNTRFPIGRLPQDEVDAVPAVNLVGTMNGAQVALKGMEEQGHGALYNFEGFGSNGMKQHGMSLYGCTKFGLTYFTKALIKETKDSPVIVGYMSPGIVITDLSLRDRGKMPPDRWEYVKKVFNIIADRVETVTPWLVEQVLANDKHGARIAWLTSRKAAGRFIKSRFKSPGNRFPELDLTDDQHAA